MCGCDATTNGQCKNCNSSLFSGYDNPQTVSSLPTTAPNSDGESCSLSREYVDVS